MYKCTECGLEYENKPDYCDCGNDEFVLTIQESEPVKKEEKPVQKVEPKTYEINNTITTQKSTPRIEFDWVSICIFITCLIFSFIIIFVWNPAINTEQKTQESAKVTENTSIPTIDKLWKENTIKPVEQKPAQVESKPIAKPAVQVPAKQTAPAKKQPAKKTTVQPTQKQVKTQTTSKPTVQQQVQNKPTQAEIEAQKALEEAKKAAEAKQKAEAEAKAAAEAAKKASIARQEYANYKISLRNAIAKKIDFTKVIGDGDCVISFKLDSNGTLINRSFAKQSTNLTLNNAVYKAIMATPTFTKPPVGYKNETLKLNISFNNGNFAITLE